MRLLGLTLCSLPLLWLPQLTQASACNAGAGVQPLPVRSTLVPPLATGLAGRPVAFASQHVLLADSRDESLALDLVLRRLQLESCVKDEFANYKPRTQFDNTPWRFQAKPGQKFTAAEFDAWMKSRGVRVAKGNAAGPAATAPAAAPTAATVKE